MFSRCGVGVILVHLQSAVALGAEVIGNAILRQWTRVRHLCNMRPAFRLADELGRGRVYCGAPTLFPAFSRSAGSAWPGTRLFGLTFSSWYDPNDGVISL